MYVYSGFKIIEHTAIKNSVSDEINASRDPKNSKWKSDTESTFDRDS